MAGELVPLVMVPRFTTYAGASVFTTIAMDVTDYQTAILNVWRGKMVTDSDIEVSCQESTDQDTWTDCAGTNTVDYDPGSETEGQVSATLKKRWFRLKIELTASGGSPPFPQSTCWVVGFLEQRQK